MNIHHMYITVALVFAVMTFSIQFVLATAILSDIETLEMHKFLKQKHFFSLVIHRLYVWAKALNLKRSC